MNSTLDVGGYPVNPTLRRALFIALLAIVASACSREGLASVEREKLFTLTYGRFENEIDLFGLDGSQGGPDTQLFMKDGMFYVANPGSQKVLQLTSFGDLLSVYYNPDTNPVPSFARPPEGAEDSVQATSGAQGDAAAGGTQPGQGSQDSAAGTATRKAVPYPFSKPALVTVDSTKRLFVVDRVPDDRAEYDNNEQVALRDVVLRFASDGRFVDYLGQEGTGGTPFPPISNVYSTASNELVVVSRTQTGARAFWFDADGNLLYRVPFSFRELPSPYAKGSVSMPSLERIVPDYQARRLYLKIDYYVENIDPETKANAGLSFDRSCVYPLELESGTYGEAIDLPAYAGVDADKLGTMTFRKPYELLGITSTGWAFLITPNEGGYALELMDLRARRIQKRILAEREDELAYNALMLSNDGIISALLATPYEASVVWWRTDSLIGEIRR